MMVREQKKAIAEDTADLVVRAREGDDAAFSALYLRHSRYVASIVFGIMGNDFEVEDVCQEIFETVSRKLPSLKEPAYFKTWLVKITVRYTRRRLAKKRRRGFFITQYFAQRNLITKDAGDQPDRGDLRDAMKSVPPDLIIPWSLQRLDGLSLDEIVASCGVSLATVKRRISKAEEIMKRKYNAV